VAASLTSDAFFESAQEFARSALEAHHARRFRRVAVDAATCLEHLAKACLAKRSPALLTELRSEANFPSLLRLLGIANGTPPTYRSPAVSAVTADGPSSSAAAAGPPSPEWPAVPDGLPAMV
jgi:hypothetical protein